MRKKAKQFVVVAFGGFALLLVMASAVTTTLFILIQRIDGRLSAQISQVEKLRTDNIILAQKVEQMSVVVAQIPPPPPPEDYTTVHTIPVGDAPVRGEVQAPVTITGFLDLQCPYSARFAPVIKQVMEAYPGQVNYVVKHYPLPFHDQAKPAVKYALAAARQGKFWEMIDAILADNSNLSAKAFDDIAKKLQLNMGQLKADMKENDAAWEKLIAADIELGTGVQVLGTPMFYVNGRKTKSRDLEGFKKEIDALLEKK